MRTDLFDFDLPADRIALRPASPRGASRLLVVRPGGLPEWEDRIIAELPDLLRPGDSLVVNDSKVIAARLKGRRIGRGAAEPEIEATLHKRIDGSHWRAFILGAKKVQVGDTLRFGAEGKVCFLGLAPFHAVQTRKSRNVLPHWAETADKIRHARSRRELMASSSIRYVP